MAYDDVVADVVRTTTALADRAVAAGVRPDGILIDPTHDFGKNTLQSLELTRRLDELAATGWPVLVAVSNKDFIGETLELPPGQRGNGTLAALSASRYPVGPASARPDRRTARHRAARRNPKEPGLMGLRRRLG
jgi:dihydropteroate synthase